MAEKIYKFGAGQTNKETLSKELLGGKGHGLREMANLGLPIPPGFTITTKQCTKFMKIENHDEGQAELTTLMTSVMQEVTELEYHFGFFPLLSVRSGARVSMPGMMDTILNVGLTTQTIPQWEKVIGERATWDSYRRLLQMMGNVVFDIPMDRFDVIFDSHKVMAEKEFDHELSKQTLEAVVLEYKELYKQAAVEVPDTLEDQLEACIMAVFKSWENPRAKAYREMNGYSDDWGTAVNIQSMVFGNLNDKSCTGVLFTRNPSNGEPTITGEFLINAQGEDVVAGIRTPDPLKDMGPWNETAHKQLCHLSVKLEKHYRDMQDIEFTVQDGELFILQCRNGKRSAKAAFRIARDLHNEHDLTKEEMLSRVTRAQYLALKTPQLENPDAVPSATGVAAGGGIVSGIVVFSEEQAKIHTDSGSPVILVANETTPDDIVAMNLSVGILTKTGGLTSHAAVVARGMDKTCVVGCTDMQISGNSVNLPKSYFAEGSHITLDGATGRVWLGARKVIPGELDVNALEIMSLHLTDGEVFCGPIEPPKGLLGLVGDYCVNMDTAWSEGTGGQWLSLATDVKGTLYANCKTPWSDLKGEDATLYTMTGLDVKKEESLRVAQYLSLLDTLGRDVKCILPSDLNVASWDIPDNVKIIKSATTVKDLLDGTGVPTGPFISDVVGGESAFTALKQMMENVGLTVASPVLPVKDGVRAYELFSE